jgi:hypothetical protein
VCLDAILGSEVDNTLLECFNITTNTQAYCVKVKNWIADKLSRAVEGDIATTVYMIKLRSKAAKILFGAEHIVLIAALTQRVDRRVLDDKDRATGLILRKALLELLTAQRIK